MSEQENNSIFVGTEYVGWVKPNIYFFVIHYLYLL